MQEIPADKPSGSLGARLCAAREARRLSVHKVAQDMRVSDDVIAAMEHDDFASLGAPIFVRGHLRNYARLLGLAEDEVLNTGHTTEKLMVPALITLQPGGLHTFGRRFAMPIFSLIIIALLLVLGVVWWQYRPAQQPAMVPANPDKNTVLKAIAAVPVIAPVHPAASGSTDVSRVEAATQMPNSAPQHMRVPVHMDESQNNPAAKSAAASDVRPAHAQIPSVEANPASSTGLTHAQFSLSQPSWIEVYDANGKRLYYDLAPAGGSLKVTGAGPLQVFLGNAPGVSIEMDGRPFNLAPFMHPDNTARFRMGETPGNNGSTG